MLNLYNLRLMQLSFDTAWQLIKERSHYNPEYQNIIEGMYMIQSEYDRERYDTIDDKEFILYCIKNQRILTAYNIVYKELGDLFTRFEDGFIPRKNEIFKSIRGGQ